MSAGMIVLLFVVDIGLHLLVTLMVGWYLNRTARHEVEHAVQKVKDGMLPMLAEFIAMFSTSQEVR